jgi:hypothetical protein
MGAFFMDRIIFILVTSITNSLETLFMLLILNVVTYVLNTPLKLSHKN